MAKKNKERQVGNSFDYNEADSGFSFQLRKKRPWWLLLLLIPLLLLALLLLLLLQKCQHNPSNYPEVTYPDVSDKPLVVYPEEPCGGATESGGDEGIVKAVKMGKTSGTFLFEYNTYSAEDRITIYNGKEPKGQPIFQYEGGTEDFVSKMVSFNSSDGFVSIVVEGIDYGTAWDFTVNCPQ